MTSAPGEERLGSEAVWPLPVGTRAGGISVPRDPPRASRSLARLRDDRLAARASKGDRTAFAELYRRHHQRLFRYCLAILHDAEDAADALQTTMAKALSALEGGETVRGVRPWLFRIAHNTSIDTVRGRRPQVDLDDLTETESSSLTAPSAASEAENRAELVQAVADIRDLPDRQAGALIMRELSGLSYPEIAAAFATSTGNARQLVHGARSALYATRRGRDVDCEVVRLALSEAEGKTPRDRRVRAHLASCEDCRAFQGSIRTRRSALAAVAPPLVSWAGADILGRVLAEGPGSGAGLAAGGGIAAGALGKIVGTSGATKLATGAAAVGTAVVAGAFVAAGTGVLGGGGPGNPEAPGFLMPDAPELRPLPMPGPERAERRTPAREPAPAATAAPATTPAVDEAAVVQRGPVSRVEPAVADGGLGSGRAARDHAELELVTVRRPGLPALAGSVEKVIDDLLGRLNLGRPVLPASGGSIEKVLDDLLGRLNLGRPGLPASGGSIEKVLDDLLGRLNLRLDPAVPVKPKLPDARLELGTVRRPGLPASDGSIEKVPDDLLGRLNLRLDPAVPVKPKLRADPDLTVNRKPPADPDVPVNRKPRVDTDVSVNRNPPADTDVRVKRQPPVDTDVRVIDPPDSPASEKPEIQVNPPELPINRRARAAHSAGTASRRQSSPERRGARPPRLDPPIQTASPPRKALTRRHGLTPGG